MIRIGTAGWTIPRRFANDIPSSGSGLERYAAVFPAVEINSTFYRSHKPETYARWASVVPEGFRFAAKLPKTITHERRLVDSGALLEGFLKEVSLLGRKLGPLLIQLPPSFAFDNADAEAFLRQLRSLTGNAAACEPRHASWFEPEAGDLLTQYRVARVAADPARVPAAAVPGGWPELAYYRLHGSPRMYYSEYDETFLSSLAARMSGSPAAETWCIFDNTASGAAAGNALTLTKRFATTV